MAVKYTTINGTETMLDKGDFCFLMNQLRRVAKAHKREKLLSRTELGREILREKHRK